ncbi:MAG: pilus assembly protein [Chloroflexota bacterium]|nr:pilus assembly protein [Chloroflexota bacterium]
MHRLRRGRGPAPGERGQALVEFALTAPILLLLVLGAVDYGRVYYRAVQVSQAARNGAAYASINPPNSNQNVQQSGNYQQQMEDAAFAGSDLAASGATVTVVQAADQSGGDEVQVDVQQQYSTLVRWPLLPTTFQLHSRAASKVLQ